MNPIQKAWLKVLAPFTYVINEKLAKRPGSLFFHYNKKMIITNTDLIGEIEIFFSLQDSLEKLVNSSLLDQEIMGLTPSIKCSSF